MISKKILDKYSLFLGKDIDLFIDSCKRRPRKAIRLNTIKIKGDVDNLEYFKENKIVLEKIDYLKNVYKIKSEVFGLGNTIEQLLGFFQMQEVSSIIPVFVLGPKENEIVLDMAAAPGNKTSLISEMMNNRGVVVANDIDKKRIKKLVYTLKKNGATNVVVSCEDACKINMNTRFDKILLDAPCSCEGFYFKKIKNYDNWSQKLVLSKANLQKRLLKKAIGLLKPNGVVVYSTCTLSPEENEEVIDCVLKDSDVVVEEIKINGLNVSEGLVVYGNKRYDTSLKKAIRIYSHKTELESFFICKLKKV